MKLTANEKAICEKYGATDETGHVHCNECPLSLGDPEIYDFTCYANISKPEARARRLKRL